MSFRGEIPQWTIYGYASRGIYKPGERVDISGFVRDMRPTTKEPYNDLFVSIELSPPTPSTPPQSVTVAVDEF